MRTSATCPIAEHGRRATPAHAHREAGFTLLEILVVLGIAALVTAAVIPAMGRVVGAVGYDSELGDVIGQLDDLGFRAYTSGKAIVLTDGSAQAAAAAGLALPGRWTLTVPQPIRFNSLGMCDGGDVTAVAPDGRTTALHLAAPDCAVATVGR